MHNIHGKAFTAPVVMKDHVISLLVVANDIHQLVGHTIHSVFINLRLKWGKGIDNERFLPP
jgi:hypothetical protein